MSLGERDSARFARAEEFDKKAVSDIEEYHAPWVKYYVEERKNGRFDMDGLSKVVMLEWRKDEDFSFLHTSKGTMTMGDIRIFAQWIEENRCSALNWLTQGAMQYAIVRTVERVRGIGRVNAGIFGVNTCGLDDPNLAKVNTGLEEIRQLISDEDLHEQNIFEKDFLIFPINRFNHATCVVILNPKALLASNNGRNRGKCHWYEIGTGPTGERDIRDYISMILDSHRNDREPGPVRRRARNRILFDKQTYLVLPPLPVQGKYNQQFQLLYMIKKILDNGAKIHDYLANDLKDIGKERYEMLKEVKEIRVRVLIEISVDMYRDGTTEYQRYLYDRRWEEIQAQERDREEVIANKTKTERAVRIEWDLHCPYTTNINEYDTITPDELEATTTTP